MAGSLDQAVAATAAKDLKDDVPKRGTILVCSSPLGEVSMAPAGTPYTLFTGAILEVLHDRTRGADGLSLADLRDAAYEIMVSGFGLNAPRPVIHQTNSARGDLTRIVAFENNHTALPPTTSQPTEIYITPDDDTDRTAGDLRIQSYKKSTRKMVILLLLTIGIFILVGGVISLFGPSQ
jgi:hypothetical protein